MADDSIAPTALLAEFQAKLREQNNLQIEVLRWRSLYVAALVIPIGWSFSRPWVPPIDELLAERIWVVTAMVALNTAFSIVTSSKEWWIHQIGFYLNEDLAPRLSRIVGANVYDWEVWRHGKQFENERSGKPDKRRQLYGWIMNWTPTLVSVALVVAATVIGRPHQTSNISRPSWRVALTLMVILTLIAGSVEWWTTVRLIPSRWKDSFRRRTAMLKAHPSSTQR